MSLRISRVHFFPRVPKLALIGQFLKATMGRMGFNVSFSFKVPHYTFGLCIIYLVCFV